MRLRMEIEGIKIDDTVDITDKVCPLTFVKAKVAIAVSYTHLTLPTKLEV